MPRDPLKCSIKGTAYVIGWENETGGNRQLFEIFKMEIGELIGGQHGANGLSPANER